MPANPLEYPEYSDDDDIKNKIFNYIYNLKKFKQDPNGITSEELNELNNLHHLFYGVSFNPENPNAGIYKQPIFDKFKSESDITS